MISEFQVGTSHLALPPDATLQYPFHRTIDATDIPDRRDDLVNASLGAKLTIPAGVTFLANAAVPAQPRRHAAGRAVDGGGGVCVLEGGKAEQA